MIQEESKPFSLEKLKNLFSAGLKRYKLTENDFLPEELFSSVLIEDCFKYEIKYAVRDGKTFILEENRVSSSDPEGQYIVYPAIVKSRRDSIRKDLRKFLKNFDRKAWENAMLCKPMEVKDDNGNVKTLWSNPDGSYS